MQTTIERIDNVTIVTIQHEALDAKSAQDFRQDLEAIVEEGNQVLLDLGNVEFVDSAGLGSIVASLKRLRSNGGELKICDVHKPVRALFELVRMHKLVDIYTERNEAIESFSA